MRAPRLVPKGPRLKGGPKTVLQARRELAGLTQDDVAYRAGISQRYVSEIERGLRQPSPRVLDQLAAAFGVAPGTLKSWLKPPPDPPALPTPT